MNTMEKILEIFKDSVKINQTKRNGETLLHDVTKRGEHEYVESLIKCGANLAAKDETGNTVLHDLAEKAGEHEEHAEVNIIVIIMIYAHICFNETTL